MTWVSGTATQQKTMETYALCQCQHCSKLRPLTRRKVCARTRRRHKKRYGLPGAPSVDEDKDLEEVRGIEEDKDEKDYEEDEEGQEGQEDEFEEDEEDEEDKEGGEADESAESEESEESEEDEEDEEDEGASGRGRPRKKVPILQRGILELALDVSRKHNLPTTATDDIIRLVSLMRDIVPDHHRINTAIAERSLSRMARVPEVVSFIV
jgi:hypothetical protein